MTIEEGTLVGKLIAFASPRRGRPGVVVLDAGGGGRAYCLVECEPSIAMEPGDRVTVSNPRCIGAGVKGPIYVAGGHDANSDSN